jgi:copper(I)-binding protein
MKLGRVSAAVTVLILATGCTRSTSAPITVRDAWARASPGMSETGGVFMTIENQTTTADALVGATTTVCTEVELHESVLEGDVMKMRPVEGGRIELPAGQVVELKPGGLHIMLIGLQQKLAPGEAFVLTLEFEQAGQIDIEVAVQQVGATEMGP